MRTSLYYIYIYIKKRRIKHYKRASRVLITNFKLHQRINTYRKMYVSFRAGRPLTKINGEVLIKNLWLKNWITVELLTLYSLNFKIWAAVKNLGLNGVRLDNTGGGVYRNVRFKQIFDIFNLTGATKLTFS